MKKTLIKIKPLMIFMIAAALFLAASMSEAFEIRKEKHENGLTVLHVGRHELPIVNVALLIKASPLNESKELAGTAYLTAKALLEGTAKRSSTDISRQIDFIGASIETSVNHDFTVISMSVLKKDIDVGFDILADVLLNPSFSETELSRLKSLLLGRLKRMEEEPSYVAGREFIKKVFGDFPYGRQVTGDAATISRISRNDIVKFYEAWYRPDKAILSVVGDLTQDELNRLLKKYLSSWKAGSSQKNYGDIKPYSISTKKFSGMEIIDMDVTQANIVMGHAGIARSNVDFYAVQVMNYIFGGGGFASRLMKVIRDDKGLTYSVYSFFSSNKYPGRFEIETQTKNESAGLVIEEIRRQMKKIIDEGVTEEELKDAKDFLIGSFSRNLETGKKIAGFLAAMEFYELGDDYIVKYKDYINKVTREDVLNAARKYFDEKNIIIVVVGNRKKLAF